MTDTNEEARFDIVKLQQAYQEVGETVDGVALMADLADEIDLIMRRLPMLMRHGADHMQDLRDANAAFQRTLHYYRTFLHLQLNDINGFLGDIAMSLPGHTNSELSAED